MIGLAGEQNGRTVRISQPGKSIMTQSNSILVIRSAKGGGDRPPVIALAVVLETEDIELGYCATKKRAAHRLN